MHIIILFIGNNIINLDIFGIKIISHLKDLFGLQKNINHKIYVLLMIFYNKCGNILIHIILIDYSSYLL